MVKPLLVTLGDTGGLGPELACRLFAQQPPLNRPVVLIGQESSLADMARRFAPDLSWERLDESVTRHNENAANASEYNLAPGLYLLEPEGAGNISVPLGRGSAEGGLVAGHSLDLACDLLLSGWSGILVTCPLNKAMLQDAGFDFPGHTEFLARRAGLGPDEVTMHLCGPKLRVSLVTTHPPLKDVPGLITRESVLRALRHTCDFTRRLGLSAPVAVCGLN
ncbi:4-hydroxythreonine-4-phosphate dehydrogenase PdxA, partial [Desulfocurvibacter africanus]|uniref:4-hydroxythreonine-4-phosphate dehydrogenase PdxA n=1 Tax=Desulfocurvibacter africanus TaxID=873 RepID=UPI002FD9239B